MSGLNEDASSIRHLPKEVCTGSLSVDILHLLLVG